jgi:hypothetical protein
MHGIATTLQRLGLAAYAVAFLGTQPGWTQTQAPQFPPLIPGNALSRSIPYEQGIANIEAQDAARPKAVQPVLPGNPTAPINPHGASPPNSPPGPAANTGR